MNPLADPRLQAIVLATTSQINEDEGFRSRAYPDTRGVPTWGYGDTRHGCALGKSCTIAEARAWRDSYLAELAQGLTANIPWWTALTTTRAAAVLNMAYQLGLGGLLRFRQMLGALRTGDFASAAAEALDSDWARQTPARAHRIAAALGPQPSTATPGHDALIAAASDHGAHP